MITVHARTIGLLFLVSVVGMAASYGVAKAVWMAVSVATCLSCVAVLVFMVRGGHPVQRLLVVAIVSSLFFVVGLVYLVLWSPPSDIGGPLPFGAGLCGMIGVALWTIFPAPSASARFDGK